MKLAKRKEIAALKSSGLFDAEWYLRQYQDVYLLRLDPVEHYLWVGAYLGRDPSPTFSSFGYLQSHPDAAVRGMNPLLHYVLHGQHTQADKNTNKTRPSKIDSSDQVIRLAIFAAFSIDKKVHRRQLAYLEALWEVCETVIVVFDNDLPPEELNKIRHLSDHIIAERHGEYDFGSYKRGLELAQSLRLLDRAVELVLCNDSCYGPVQGFDALFANKKFGICDFWGLTKNTHFQEHIQTYFVVFKKKVFANPLFFEFFRNIRSQPTVSQVILSYEVPMTAYFSSLGYTWSTLVDDSTPEYSTLTRDQSNITVRPIFLLEQGCPLIKVKAVTHPGCNYDGVERLLEVIQAYDQRIYDAIIEHKTRAGVLVA